jgi:hypothetical protein
MTKISDHLAVFVHMRHHFALNALRSQVDLLRYCTTIEATFASNIICPLKTPFHKTSYKHCLDHNDQTEVRPAHRAIKKSYSIIAMVLTLTV